MDHLRHFWELCFSMENLEFFVGRMEEEVLIIKVRIYYNILIRRLYFFNFLNNWNSLLEEEDLVIEMKVAHIF